MKLIKVSRFLDQRPIERGLDAFISYVTLDDDGEERKYAQPIYSVNVAAHPNDTYEEKINRCVASLVEYSQKNVMALKGKTDDALIEEIAKASRIKIEQTPELVGFLRGEEEDLDYTIVGGPLDGQHRHFSDEHGVDVFMLTADGNYKPDHENKKIVFVPSPQAV